jgi:hypothetical protein
MILLCGGKWPSRWGVPLGDDLRYSLTMICHGSGISFKLRAKTAKYVILRSSCRQLRSLPCAQPGSQPQTLNHWLAALQPK